jgi:serine/threonine protein kinase
MEQMTDEHVSWDFEDGQEMVPGRMAIYLLGGGIRAEAWLAWDMTLHTVVVVKLLRPDYLTNDRARKSMAREARTLKRLQHPAIVRMFDAVTNGARPFLVLESLDGPRVSSLIRMFGRLTPEQLVPLGLEVASALAFMHKSGYVHLDVKPRNIIMSASPTLIDLGLARPAGEVRDIAYHVGTDEYMAPEQAAIDTRNMGPASDIWGLGVTLYEAAMRKRPFPDPTDDRPYPQLDMEPAPLDRRFVPDVIAQVIMSCLQRDPAARPKAVDLAADLEGLIEEARLVAGQRLRSRYRR